jgi:hypothetical protein
VPAIRGLDREDEPDPFARSVIARILADLADAAAVRGDFAQMRTRLTDVERLAPPRPWGNMQGASTLLAAVERRAKEGDASDDALRDPRPRAAADRRRAAHRRPARRLGPVGLPRDRMDALRRSEAAAVRSLPTRERSTSSPPPISSTRR